MKKPYLSIVIAVRNDNYGGDFTQRLQQSINWNTKWLEYYKLPTEFVLVNWNPVGENQPLLEMINWPSERQYVNYRIINVPNHLHEQLVDPTIRETVPMFEFIAKNVGIRRSQGEVVLSTNADILLHPKICRAIGNKKVHSRKFYRANRLDFEYMNASNLKQLYTSGFTVSLKGFMYALKPGATVAFQYAMLKMYNPLWLWWELFKYRNLNFFVPRGVNVVVDNGGYQSHCLNSGDFMLMTSENWKKLKAYPEHTPMTLHTDALFNVLAAHFLKEQIFVHPIFHQAHIRRYPWDQHATNPAYKEAYYLFEKAAMCSEKNETMSPFMNAHEWGLSNQKLNEQTI